MALADVYEIRMSGTVLNVNWNMIFHALRANSGFDAENVVTAFYDTTYTLLRTTTANDVYFDDLECKSLGNALDFFAYSLGHQLGLANENVISPFATYPVRFTRKRTDMKHGMKRLPGASEEQTNLGQIEAARRTAIGNWAAALIGNWEENTAPGTHVANYCIVKRVLEVGEYRLPIVDGELVYYVPTEFSVGLYISTQNSRKFS